MRKTMSALTMGAAIAALTLLPSEAWAQACLANVAGGGQGHAAAGTAFTDGAWGLGGTVGFNAPGPVGVQGNYTRTMYDESDVGANSLGAEAGLELLALPVSLCPTAGVTYTWVTGIDEFDASVDGWAFGGGLSFGHTIRNPSGVGFTPHLSASVVHDRVSASEGQLSVTVSETYGAFSGGMLLSSGSLYGGPAVSLSTLEGSDPVFSVSLGVVFGPRL